MDTHYMLPCSSSAVCEDRLSILEGEQDLLVPTWKLLETLLVRPIPNVDALIDLLENIAISLRGKAQANYEFLRQFIVLNAGENFFITVWPGMCRIALRLPELFPRHAVPILTPSSPYIELSREQTACLVVHQFLCTLAAPVWQDGFQSFHIWYDSDPPHYGAVEGYLIALFAYLRRLCQDNLYSPLRTTREQWNIKYCLVSGCAQPLHAEQMVELKLPELVVRDLPVASTAPRYLGLSKGAAVVSANRSIGFGPSGTQEELHIGTSPEACPAVLVTPPLKDDEVLVVIGAESMVNMDGYGRDAVCSEILSPIYSTTEHCKTWKDRAMLFMDALELDLVDAVPGFLSDLKPGYVARELNKATRAFSSYRDLHRENPYSEVVTGFWGCRAFGGNPSIKALIQWCAAGRAGSRLEFICSDEKQRQFGGELREFVAWAGEQHVTCMELEKLLLGMRPLDSFEAIPPLEFIRSELTIRRASWRKEFTQA